MKQSEKILVYGALGLSFIIFFFIIISNAYGYVGVSNITGSTVNDSRVDPNQTITWTVGPILNSTDGFVGGGNSSVFLDGGGAYVQVADDPSLDRVNFSVEGFFKLSNITSKAALVSHYGRDGWRISVLNVPPYVLRVDLREVSGATGNYDTINGASLVGWNYFQINYFNSSTSKLDITFNGINESYTGVRRPQNEAHVIEIGAVSWNADFLNGTIDEVRIYNRTLSPTEVYEHSIGIYRNDTLLVGHWDLDGNYLDRSPQGNDGVAILVPSFVDGWAFDPVLNNISGQAALVNSTTGLMSLIQDAPTPHGNYTVETTIVGAIQNTTYVGFIVDLYNIDVSALYTEVEAGFNSLIYANGSSVIDGHELTDGDTLIINGVTLTWNTYMSRFESTVTSGVPAIVTYDTLTTLLEDTYDITNGNITTAPTVTWTTPKIDLIVPFLRIGDWPGFVIEINVLLMGATMFWTFLLMSISMGVYNYSGPEVTLLVWMLGWGTFNTVIHGQAQTIALIMMAVGGGVYIAKFFLDRRTTV